MKKIIVLSVVAILLISSFPTIVLATQPSSPAPASGCSSGQILVSFEPGTSRPVAARIHRQLGGQTKATIPGIGVQVVIVSKGRAMAMAKAYSANPKVAYAEPDFMVQALGDPDDSYFANQWALTTIGAPQAWDVTTGNPNIKIAILDTGVDQDHPDLASKILSNINFSSSPTVDDVDGHGTHIAGIAAAMTDNGIGVAGVGYNSNIMNVKVLGDTGAGTYSGLISGIIWAVDNGADVISMSLGGSSYSSTLENAVNYAWSKGVVVVAAAGNYGSTTPFYPAAHANCMAVAATNGWDVKADWSNYGDWVDVAAPGVIIYATLKDNSYGYMSGTSMAAPHVAGLAALVFTTVSDTNDNGKLNDEVRSRIEATCDDIGVIGIGAGRINAYEAVSGDSTIPPSPPPGTITGTATDAEDGSPIVGATVTEGDRTTTTDASGGYTITDIPPGTYQVTASKSGYYSSSLTVTVVSGSQALADFSLTEVILPGSITGSVTDAQDGSPIAGATVTDGTRTATTDSSGEYTVADVPAGDYEVTASKEGYETSPLTVNVISGSTTLANFSLSEVILPGTIIGQVTDAEDGSPIAGAVVTDGTRTTNTDASGEYTIADVPAGTYQVTASKSGYESSMSTVTVVQGGTAVINFSLNTKLAPINVMWVDNIHFIMCGKNLFIEVSIATDSGVVVGANVDLSLECSNGEVWNFSGTTNTAGLVKFKVSKAPVGSYMTTVTGLTCSGFTWDTTKGITTAGYALSG